MHKFGILASDNFLIYVYYMSQLILISYIRADDNPNFSARLPPIFHASPLRGLSQTESLMAHIHTVQMLAMPPPIALV